MMCWRCTCTVCSLMASCRAMALLAQPSASQRATSVSRGDKRVRMARASWLRWLAAWWARLSSTARSMASRKGWSRKGFCRKSTAPAFMASTASSTSPWPVTKISGNGDPAACKRRCNSRPLTRGMRISATRQPPPGGKDGSAARNASALSWPLAGQPADSSRNSTERKNGASSSITCTWGAVFMQGDSPGKAGAATGTDRGRRPGCRR